jgi:hypothetical protein
MKKEFIGLNPLSVEGARFEMGYGFSKFVNLKLNNKEYSPVIAGWMNTWGFKHQEDRVKEKVYAIIKEQKDCLFFSIDCKDVEITGPFIAGYPSIKLGNSIWGPSTGFELGQIKDYRKMNISAKWDFKVKGNANFAFDLWLTKDKSGTVKEKDIELMIWIDYNFDLPHEKIGATKDFIIKFKEKGFNDAYWITFLANNKKGESNFDLIDIFNECKKKIADIEEYHIRSIELGVEFAKNTSAQVNLKKLNLDFVNRSKGGTQKRKTH